MRTLKLIIAILALIASMWQATQHHFEVATYIILFAICFLLLPEQA